MQNNATTYLQLGMKTVRIFSDRIRDRIRLEGFRSVCIQVWIFNIRYRIRIWILKSYIYDVDIQSYLIWLGWDYPYSNPNPTKNMKTNMISMISVRIRSIFIPTYNGSKFHNKRLSPTWSLEPRHVIPWHMPDPTGTLKSTEATYTCTHQRNIAIVLPQEKKLHIELVQGNM